jgi:hypothetical protein
MAFVYNIPQPTDRLSVSQGQILGNFQALGAIAGNTNAASASINTNPGSGFNWVYLSGQTNIPPTGSSIPAGEIALYSALSPITGINEAYISKFTGNGTEQLDMTGSILSQTAVPTQAIQGWTRLPSGIVLYWGPAQLTASSSPPWRTNINITAGPVLTNILNVQVTYAGNATTTPVTISTGIVSNSQISIYCSATSINVNVYYFIIGY